MSVKLSNKDYIWSYIGVILSLCSSIVMTPFVVYFLDGPHYGLWSVFQSIAAITVIFDFGFTTTFSRNINYCWNGAERLEKTGAVFSKNKEPNYFLMKKTMRACRLVFFLISAVAFFFMLTIGTVYVHRVSGEIGGPEPIIAWLIFALAIFLNLFFGYYGAFLRGVGAIYQVNRSTVIAKSVQIVLTIALLAFGLGIIGTSIAYLAYGTLYRQLARNSFFKYRGIGNELNKHQLTIPKEEIKELFLTVWHNAWREGLVSLANYLSNSACTIIISLFMPLTQTGAYSLGVHLATAVAHIAAAMYTANQPVLQSAYITNDKEKTRRTMSLIVFSFVFLYVLGILAVVIVGLPILRLIRPETVVGAGVMLGIGAYQFMLKFRNCYTSYFSCTNRIIYAKAFIVSAALCVVLALLSMKYLLWGMWGLIGAQIFSQAVFNFWYWPIKSHREMQLSVFDTVRLGAIEFKAVVLNLLSRFIRKKQ